MTREWAETLHRRYRRLTRVAMRLRDRRGSHLPMELLAEIDAKQRRIRLDAEAGGWNIENPFEMRERPPNPFRQREMAYARRAPHTFEPRDPRKPWTAAKNDCRHCGQGPGASAHLLKLELEIEDERPVVEVEVEEEEAFTPAWNPDQGSLFA